MQKLQEILSLHVISWVNTCTITVVKSLDNCCPDFVQIEYILRTHQITYTSCDAIWGNITAGATLHRAKQMPQIKKVKEIH